MAPEQAKGKPVDKRADIWAFGCVLYEMLTGRRAFAGDDVSTTLAAVLLKDPDWQAVPAADAGGARPVAATLPRRKIPRRASATSAKRGFASMHCCRVRRMTWPVPSPRRHRRRGDACCRGLPPVRSRSRRCWRPAPSPCVRPARLRPRRSCSSPFRRRTTRPLAVRWLAAPASHRSWPCPRMASTSCSWAGPRAPSNSGCDRSRRWPPARFKGPRAARFRSGRPTAGTSRSSRRAS